ncbi:MAG: flagellar biosynthesis protein FlhB [Alphaproteobacteria bacterium]
MSDDNQQDDSQKTEEPTQRKIEKAREKGQIAQSREINNWFIILAASAIVGLMAPYSAQKIGGVLRNLIAFDQHSVTDTDGLTQLVKEAIQTIFGSLVLPIIFLVIAVLAAGFSQSGFLVSAESLKPKLSRLSILEGIKRIFSTRNLFEFIKGVVKIAIVGAAVMVVLSYEIDSLRTFIFFSPIEVLSEIRSVLLKLLITVLTILSVIAGTDYIYQRFEYYKKLRMSRQDIKDEMKESDGDPQIKQKLAQIRRQRANERMMDAVPDATVVVANPTHFAVALKYDMSMEAPMAIAKGVDSLALRIREKAEDLDIPVVEDPPLAQALYAGCDVGEEIPEQHYSAVAAVIRYVMTLNQRRSS